MFTKRFRPILVHLFIVMLLTACSSFQSSSDQEQMSKVQIDQVEVKIGVGSPIPVEVLINGTLFDTCAEFKNIEQQVENFEFSFIIEAQETGITGIECLQDTISFSITVPLNMVNRPAGEYTVIVHNVSTSFIWPPPASE